MKRRIWLLVLGIVAVAGLLTFQLLSWLPGSEPSAWYENGQVVIEQSTPSEIEAYLGSPDTVEVTALGTRKDYVYYYGERGEQLNSPNYRFTFQNGKLIAIDDHFPKGNPLLGDFIAAYGRPGVVTWAAPFVGRRVVIFQEKGILLVTFADEDPNQVHIISAYYFVPCSMVCIKLSYGRLFGSGPGIVEPYGMLDPLPEDPWGYTSQ